MRVQVFLCLLSWATTGTLAIKGGGASLRRQLQEPGVAPPPRVLQREVAMPSAPKIEKKKTCKKAKKGPPKAAPPPSSRPAAHPRWDDDIPYCLHGERTDEECAAARRGDVPTTSDKSIQGILRLEVLQHDSSRTDEQMVDALGEILRTQTSAKYVGCPDDLDGARFLQQPPPPPFWPPPEGDASPPMMMTAEPITVTGIGFGSMVIEGRM